MIRRKKTTIFTDAKESTPVSDVKKIVEGILKIRPEDQKLFKDDQVGFLLCSLPSIKFHFEIFKCQRFFVKFGQEIIFTPKMQKGIEWVLTLNYVSVRGQGHDGSLC